MIKDINNITVPLNTSVEEVLSIAIKKSGLSKNSVTGYKIKKRSVDARRKDVRFNYSISLFTNKEKEQYQLKFEQGLKPMESNPVIIGSGPAGLFCAYILAEQGYKPVLYEQGKCVEERVKAIDTFNTKAVLDPDTNIQFGEGGAGTFSDGKLTTRINDPLCDQVLNIFAQFGAPEEILYVNKPHIGTDILQKVIVNMRNRIKELGGKVFFGCKLNDFTVLNGRIHSILVNNEEIKCNQLVLATGHSARDMYYLLAKKGIFIEPKAFAVGVRIEHNRDFIDKSQYGDYAGHPALGAADYRLAYNGKDRSCFSFCMCPGGYVVAAASEDNSVTVNGMSNHSRNGNNSNSALVVNVTQNDYDGILGGIEFQRHLEQSAFNKTMPYYAPVQSTADFIKGKTSNTIKGITPTYPIGTYNADINKILPSFVSKTLREGLLYFDSKIKNFSSNSLLTGVETRTSAPVRITRNEQMESISVAGMYPAGEGAGYAGGIMSAAVDGIKVAKTIISKYAPF